MLAAIVELRADSSAASVTGGGAHASGDATTLVLRPAPAASESTPAGRGGDAPLEPGTRVGRYRIVEWVGAGGMGVVYAAFDPELNRKVAIKVLRYEVGKDDRPRRQFEERLRREAQVMARVAHPNVAAVYDVSEYGGRAFVAMEYIEGETLARWLKRRERPWPAVLERYVAAGRGLAAAHAAGLVHRDFKPQNVLVGDDERVRVVDFGLARLVESAGGPGEPPPRASLPATPKRLSELTATGALLGTPSYMAPEQWRRAAVDARTDQFSFCVALYAALYGERPFAGDDAAAAAVATASAARVRRAPRGTKVPGHVRRALLRGLAAAPGDRFPSMDALLAALAHEPPRPARAAAVSALVAAGIACGALLARRRAEAPRPCAAGEARVAQVWGPPRRRAVGEALRHTGAPYAATVAGEAVDVLDRYAARWAAQYGEACAAPRDGQGEEATRLRVECLDDRLREFKALGDRLLEADAGVAEQAVQAAHRLSDLDACSDAHAPAAPPPSDPATRSEVDALRDALVEARSLMQAGRYRDGLAAARPLADRARQTGYRPVEAEALYLVGALAERSGDFAAAERDLEQATLAAEAGRHDELTAQALGDLIFVRGGRLARYESLDLLERRAFAVLERLGTPGELEAPLRVSLGQVNLMRSRYPEAERNLARALALLERRYGPDDVRLVGPLAARGWLDLHRHEAPAARASFERALALARASLGDDHPEAARMMGGLAEALRLGGEYGEAEALYRRELAIYERAFGPDSHQTINALNDLALLYGAQRRYADAVPLHERAVALAERGRGPDHPATAICLASLGAALAERGGRGDLAASLAALRRAVATLGRPDGEDPQRYADALLALSSTQSKLGRPSAALATALHGLDVYQRGPGSEGPPPHALHTLGAIYLRLRRPARAIAPLEAALDSPRRAGCHAPELARTTALLARALGESGRAPARARALALEAHAALANEPTPAPELAALERWMRKRGIRPSGAPPPPGRAPAPR